MRCPHCGFEDPEDYLYCSECGKLRGATPPPGVPVDPFGGTGERAAAAQRPWPPEPSPGAGYDLPQAAGATARLVGLEGRVSGQDFPLTRPETRIGRQSDCEISIPDQSISRLHAWVRQVPGGYTIEDAQSSNGTWVNGVRLSDPYRLAPRDVIRVGNAAFDFQLDVPAARMPAGPMTVVSDVGDDPSPFGDDQGHFGHAPVHAAPPTPPPASVTPPPRRTPPPAEAHTPLPARPPSWPGAGARRSPASAPPEAVGDVRAELAELERDLGPFIERLTSLATSLRSIEGRLDDRGARGGTGGIPPALRELAEDLEADGGTEQYRALQAVLDQLQSRPTDVKLLLELSDELPSIERLLDFYVRALDALRDAGQG